MKRYVLAVAALGVAALVAVLFFRVFEFREVEVSTPPSPEAERNPFLALERFGEAMGLGVRTAEEFEAPPVDTSCVWLYRGGVEEPEAERLAAWVADGGRLWIVVDPSSFGQAVIAERTEDEVPDPLLEAFGLEWTFIDPFDFDWRDADADANASSVELDGEFYRVRIESPVVLASSPDNFLDNLGLLADVKHGRGTVVVSAGGAWLTSDELGNLDHASLFWELLQRERPIDDLLVVRGDDDFQLAAWMSGAGISLAAILFLAVAFLLARRGMRLGPMLPELPRSRRDFTEHLAATGTFLWARSDRRRLVKRLRAAVAPDAPDPGPEREAWIEHVALATGLDRGELVTAWSSSTTPDAKRFIHTVRTLAAQARATDSSRDPR